MFGSGQGSPRERAAEFLKVANQFKLGDLATEASHPKTKGLAQWAQNDLSRAVGALHEVDVDALNKMRGYLPEIIGLHQAVKETLRLGRRIYLCGCGATGRLSLSLESLWRRQHKGEKTTSQDQVRAFMAGGDTALVHALEGFEDYPAYGERQLMELGFQAGDLLISCTEGGETPFVIGATTAAANIKGVAPYFLYCNPDHLLREKVQRSRLVLDHEGIKKVNLSVGPMALAGSTRMQASTVLMLAVGLALFSPSEDQLRGWLEEFASHIEGQNYKGIIPFVEKEAEIYRHRESVLYHSDDYAITVFTDTAERAPTFSLPPFENQRSKSRGHSLCYVVLDSTGTAQESWQRLLSRPAHSLNWGKDFPKSDEEYLWGFDFSREASAFRRREIPGRHHDFYVKSHEKALNWEFEELHTAFQIFFPKGRSPELFHHLQLKLLLNAHSTLVMGRLDRFRQNFMTWVTPTNGKLVDRAARYVTWLLEEDGIKQFTYEQIIQELFEQKEILASGESVVLKTYASLKAQIRGGSVTVSIQKENC
jgi:N-acetylmuramic acid 6-phosphate etherase